MACLKYHEILDSKTNDLICDNILKDEATYQKYKWLKYVDNHFRICPIVRIYIFFFTNKFF